MKTIIVATDYSSASNNALQYAAQLAAKVHADLMLVNSYHLSIHASNALLSPGVIDDLQVRNETRLQEVARETAQKYKLEVNCATSMENIIEQLNEHAKFADLIIMGMQSNLMEYKLFGNTTTNAIKLLKTPVLVVPNDVPFHDLKKILFAYDHNCLDHTNHLNIMKELARKFRSRLQVFHVDTKATNHQDENLSRVETLLQDVNHTYHSVVNPKIGDGIVQGVNDFHADLLVMVPHKAGFLESLLKGSNTRQMTLKTRVPLLVLPSPSLN